MLAEMSTIGPSSPQITPELLMAHNPTTGRKIVYNLRRKKKRKTMHRHEKYSYPVKLKSEYQRSP
jgi:hypothetical protein